MKFHYLTPQEVEKLSREEVNLQIALGLKSCKTLADVTELLEDVRTHEKIIIQKALEKLLE